MEIKIVENAKEILCDVLIINKFEGKETSNALVNRFAPKSFEGKPGQIFVIHTQKEYPATEILAIGLGKEQEMDNNIIRENIAKAIKKSIELKAKSVAIDFSTDYEFIIPAIMGLSIANYHFDKYKTKKEHRISEVYVSNVSGQAVELANTIGNHLSLLVIWQMSRLRLLLRLNLQKLLKG